MKGKMKYTFKVREEGKEDIEKEEIKQTAIKITRIAKKNNDIASLFLRRY